MAKESIKARPRKRERLVAQFATKREALKKAGDSAGLQKLPRNASPVRLKNRCKLTGRPKGYMKDFGICHKGTARPGGYTVINGRAYDSAWNRPRGHAAIEQDGSTYFYRVSRDEAGAFRRWAERVFCNFGENRLRGTFPSYYVD